MLFGKYVNKFYSKYWYHFFTGILFLIIVDLAQLYLPQLIGNVVSIFTSQDPLIVIQRNNFFSAAPNDPNGYAYLLLAILSIGTILLIGRAGWRIAINGLGINIDYDLRKGMFAHAEKLSVTYYKKQKTGTLMAIFNNDLESVKAAFTDGMIYIIDALVLGTISIAQLFQINWKLALIAVVPLGLMAVCGGLIGKAINTRYEAQLSSFERLSDFTQENYSGISVIKAFVREGYEMVQFAKHNQENRETNIRYLRYSIALNSVIDLLIYSIVIIIMFVGGYFAVNNEKFDAGSLTKFFGYFDALIWPMIAIAQLINLTSQSYASLKKVSAFLDAPIDLQDAHEEEDGSGTNHHLSGDVEFRSFNFHYPDSPLLVLKDIDVHIKAGENIGIVGRTGSGKSTLVKILLKIYNIEDGKLFFDGRDINKITAKDIRSNIGYVAQNAFLFSDLIRNNIAFADEKMTDADITKAASFACIDDSIRSFKDGYKTMVGEKGTTLSGGQKQRIAMARAIVKNPAILILDDSVSAVDSDTEQKILANIKLLRKGKTTFIVSSRISAVETLDHIIVMDQGSIVGYGRHEDLLKTCSLYKETVELQELEKEAKPDVK